MFCGCGVSLVMRWGSLGLLLWCGVWVFVLSVMFEVVCVRSVVLFVVVGCCCGCFVGWFVFVWVGDVGDDLLGLV